MADHQGRWNQGRVIRHDRVPIPTVWVAFALSLVLHALLLWGWLPKVLLAPFEDSSLGNPLGSLAVRLAQAPEPVPVRPQARAMRSQPAAAERSASPRTSRQESAAAPVLALDSPSPASATAPAAGPARPPAENDLASFIEARRRAREPVPAPPPSPPPAESEQERHNRVVAASLGLDRVTGLGAERSRGGGVFQIQRLGKDEAEFIFFGWNKTVRRNLPQVIDVRRDGNPSIELAVVRRMIAIIRDNASGDFLWESRRLGRDVSLSSRPADNAALEEFLMQDFFAEFGRRK